MSLLSVALFPRVCGFVEEASTSEEEFYRFGLSDMSIAQFTSCETMFPVERAKGHLKHVYWELHQRVRTLGAVWSYTNARDDGGLCCP